MAIVLLGQNHRSAPVELREQLAVDDGKLERLRELLIESTELSEGAVLSTCNRVELYAVGDDAASARTRLAQLLERLHGVDAEALSPTLYWQVEDQALRHLFRVAAGLDSMVVGEGQILHQVRDAGAWARRHELARELLPRVFDAAVGCGKRVRTDTRVGEGSVSVASAAVGLARKIFDDLSGEVVLLVGAGETGERVARHMGLFGVQDLRVANRTFERAAALAGELGASAIPWDGLDRELEDAGVVVVAVGGGVLLGPDRLKRTLPGRGGRPMFCIDLSVPRAIDPACGELPGVFLYDIDDLQQIVQRDNEQRAGEARRAESIVDDQLARFLEWYRSRTVAPALGELRAHLERIRQEELARSAGRLDEATLAELDRASRRMLRRMLHEPTVGIKKLAARGEGDELLRRLQELFGLDPQDPR